ncbi:hypothetical protein [Ectopseudomonas mendocina]|uniref:hypothetical protein n=1 Tax=Ectopseudomonas mendocina TaxID=300 RepID=UPI0006932ADC|nr:hypothetical protein [Pseudomonas mendocina]VEE17586.1 Uncharacterised protein [Pseudomonas mendocina]
MIEDIVPLVLGGIEILPHSGPIRQRYEYFGGSRELRMASGRGVKQTHWRKTSTSISATGHLDPALESLDYSRPLELLCVAPKWVGGTALVYELPAAQKRRPDQQPWAIAMVGGNWVDTGLVLDGDVATVAPIPGARAYRVGWLPRLMVLTDGPVTETDDSRELIDWSMDAREA